MIYTAQSRSISNANYSVIECKFYNSRHTREILAIHHKQIVEGIELITAEIYTLERKKKAPIAFNAEMSIDIRQVIKYDGDYRRASTVSRDDIRNGIDQWQLCYRSYFNVNLEATDI